MRYVLYARKSSESEDRQVQSIDAQLAVLRRFAGERGLDVVRELTETHSAKSEGVRPVFAQMLRLLKSGGADAILCWSINRLSRNPEDSGRLAGMLQRGEIGTIQTPERCYRPEDNVLLWAVEAGMANQDILDLRRNTARGMAAKVEKGWFPHMAPQGYLNDRHKEQGERTISPDPERFALIRGAFETLLAGSCSVNRVHRMLTDEWGYRTPPRRRSGGGLLSRSAFYAMVRNVFYAGYFVEGGDLHRGAHEPMITLAQFHQLQAALGREAVPRSRREAWAYTGLIRCAHCGGMVTAEAKRKPSGRTYRYYHCNGGSCRRYHVREEALEARIESVLCEIALDAETAALVRASLADWEEAQEGVRVAAGEARQRALSGIQSRLNALLDAMLSGLVDGEEYAAKKRELQAEKALLTEEQERHGSAGPEVRSAVGAAVGFHERSLSTFMSGDPLRRRSVARLLGSGYVLERGELRIELNPVLRPLLHAGLTGSKSASRSIGNGEDEEVASARFSASKMGAGSWEIEDPIKRESLRAEPQNRTLEVGSASVKSPLRLSRIQSGAPNRTLTERIFSILDEIAHVATNDGTIMAGLVKGFGPDLCLPTCGR